MFEDDYCYYLFLSIWSSTEGIKNGGTAVGGNINQYRQYGKQFLKALKRKLLYDPEIPLLGINGQQEHEKMLNIINDQKNARQNPNKL